MSYLLKGLENGRSDDVVILSSTNNFLHWGWIHSRTTMKEASWVQWFPMDSKRLKYGQVHGPQFSGAAKQLCPECLRTPASPVFPWVKKSRKVLGWISDHEAERNGNWQERKIKQFIILWKPAQGPILEAKVTGKHVDFPSYNDKAAPAFLQHLWAWKRPICSPEKQTQTHSCLLSPSHPRGWTKWIAFCKLLWSRKDK